MMREDAMESRRSAKDVASDRALISHLSRAARLAASGASARSPRRRGIELTRTDWASDVRWYALGDSGGHSI